MDKFQKWDSVAGDNGGNNNICQCDLPSRQGAQSRDSVHIQQPIIETMIIISLMIIVIRMIGVCLSVRDKTMKKIMMIVIISFFIPISL